MFQRKPDAGRASIVFLAVLVVFGLGSSAFAQEGEIPITTSSPEARALMIQARDLIDNEHNTEARKLLDQAIAKDPDFVMALCSLSAVEVDTAKSKQFLDRAVALLDKAKISDGERMWVQVMEAGWKSDTAKRLQLLEAMVKAYPRDRWAHLQLGWQYRGLQRYDQATAEFKGVTEIAPDFAPAYMALGVQPMASGRGFEEGERALQKYTELMPKEPNAWDTYGWLLVKEGKVDEALAMHQKALDLDPKFCWSLLGKGFDLLLKNKLAEGRKRFTELLAVAPDNGWRRQAHIALAASYLLERKFAPALQEQKKLRALFEKTKDYAALVGIDWTIAAILFQQGKAKETAAHLTRCKSNLEKSGLPEERKAKDRVWLSSFAEARLALLKKDLKTAKQKASEFQGAAEKEIVPGWKQAAHFLQGLIALQEKRWDDALTELGQANPRSPEAMVLLGDAALGKGDKDKAREAWTRAVNFNDLDIEYALMRPVAQKKLSALK